MQCWYPQSLSSDEYLRIWAGPCIAGTLPRSGRASTLLCLAPHAVSWIYLFCYTIYVGIPSKSSSVYIYTHMITLHIWLHVYIYIKGIYTVWLVVWKIFYFAYIENNDPNWLIFFRSVETTNQLYMGFLISVTVDPSVQIPKVLGLRPQLAAAKNRPQSGM